MPREQDVECIAKFNLGRSKTVAYNVFGKLKGNRDINENDPLRMEFIETQNELPMSIDFISCTLEEIGENSKIIIKELFKSSLSLTD